MNLAEVARGGDVVNSSETRNSGQAERLEALVLDLANAQDNQLKRLRWRHVGEFVSWPSYEDLVNWQAWLRQAWLGDDRDVRFLFSALAHEVSRNAYQSWVFDGRQPYAVRPNYKIFALSLAIGVSELLPKMAVCANRSCPNRYFLKGRKTQRFCDTPLCTAYGQREHKRNWWREHGKEWKETRKTQKMKRGKHAKAKKA